MKNILIHTNSLVGKAYPAVLEIIRKNAGDSEFLLFRDWKKTAAAAGVSDEYEAVMSALKTNNAHVRELDEYSLDEFLFKNKKAEIYLTPIESSSQIVVASASILGFEGKLYIFAYSANQPPIVNLTEDIRIFGLKKSAGLTHLDRTVLDYTYSPGEKCYFTVDGKDFCETIKDRSQVADAGTEGFTQVCESDNSYRIKIYDCFKKTSKKSTYEKKKFEIDRLCAMMKETGNEDIALPLACVTDKNGNIIGFVMKNIRGAVPLDIDRIRHNENAFKYIRDILSQLLWLETRSFLHHDVDHNIVAGIDGKAHIIDMDSVQYKVWPSSAYTMLPINALPECYKCDNYFFNTVDLSYTALCLLAAAIVDHTKLFGRKQENGFYKLNEECLKILAVASPELAELIVDAHTIGQPVSVARLLEINEGFLKEIEEGSAHDENEEEIKNAYEKADEIINKLKKQESNGFADAVRNEETVGEDDYADNSGFSGQDYDTVKNEADEKDGFSDNANDGADAGFSYENANVHRKKDNSTSKEASSRDVNVKEPPRDIGYTFLDYIRYEIILPMLMTGTAVFGETKEETYARLMSEGQWKRPLFGALLVICVIVVLFVGILFL